MLTERTAGSHMVGLIWDFCGPLHATPGPTLLRPVPVGCAEGGQGLVGSSPQLGIGPREFPSHASQPTAQPLLNQNCAPESESQRRLGSARLRGGWSQRRQESAHQRRSGRLTQLWPF